MFYEDEGAAMEVDGGFIEGSLDAIEKQSALRTAALLESVEDLLYAASDDETGSAAPVDDSVGEAGGLPREDDGGGDFERFDYDRHCGVGYNAHHDGVGRNVALEPRGRGPGLSGRPGHNRDLVVVVVVVLLLPSPALLPQDFPLDRAGEQVQFCRRGGDVRPFEGRRVRRRQR